MLDFVLRDLSKFAREVDSGARTLIQARNQDGMPDRLLTELRTYIHEHPHFGPRILKYLRSKEEPLTARALAVIAIAQPDRPEIVRLVASFLADPQDMKLVTAWGIGFESFRDSDWDLSFNAVPMVSESPSWRIGWGGIGIMQEPGRGPLDELDFAPVLEALLLLMNRDDVGVGRALALVHARILSRRLEATVDHRRRVQELAKQSYLRADEAWGVAMDSMPADVLAQGLRGLPIDRLLLALSYIAERDPQVLHREPCTTYVDESIRYLSRNRQEGGPNDAEFAGYCWEILNAPEGEARAEFMLFESPSITLRRRSVESISHYLPYRDPPEKERWTKTLERLSKDPDARVSRTAAWVLAEHQRLRR